MSQRVVNGTQVIMARAVGFVMVLAVALGLGRFLLTAPVFQYDDEGYLLLLVQHYLAGGRLYTEVFSQYGPFYTFAEKAMWSLLGLPVSPDHGRVITLILWVLAAGFGGGFVYRLSKNYTLALAAGLSLMITGRVLGFESGHPQQIILPLMMLACCVSWVPGRTALFVLGAVGSMLVFTKINIGVFLLAAVALAVVCGLPAGVWRRVCAVGLLAYAALMPAVLMHANLRTWAGPFAVISTLGAVGVFAAALVMTRASAMQASATAVRSAVYVVTGLGTVSLLIIGGVLLQGMSLGILLHGVILGPLQHPGVFHTVFWMQAYVPLLIAVEFMLVTGLFLYRGRLQSWVDAVDALRCVAGLLTLAVMVRPGTLWSVPFFIGLLPLSLLRLGGRRLDGKEDFGRIFVTALAATQLLQIYPVAGAQVAIAFTGTLLWAFVMIHDGADGLVRVLGPLLGPAGGWLQRQVKPLASGLFLAALMLMVLHQIHWFKPRPEPPSRLRGSAFQHMPAKMELLYEGVADNVAANCDMLFTMPGMGSLNFWSNVPTPDGFNLTAWVSAIPAEDQAQTLMTLRSDPKACVVYQPKLLENWQSKPKDLENSPLARYVLDDMRPVWEREGYEIRVSPVRTAPWVTVGPR